MRVMVLEVRGAAAVVEWRDGAGLHRAIVPSEAVTSTLHGSVRDFDVDYTTLAQGIPSGEAWELLDLGQVGAERVAQELRERGLWTADDVLKNVSRARAAFAAAYSKDLEMLLNVARAHAHSSSRE